MKHTALGLALALALSLPALAAKPPKTNFMDHSADKLVDEASAKAIMDEAVPAKAWKIYPASKYVWLSQVEGGITSSGHCVVTARVMVLPRTATVGAVLFRPQKTATTFDTLAASTSDQCSALAKTKLKEATLAVVSSIVKI